MKDLLKQLTIGELKKIVEMHEEVSIAVVNMGDVLYTPPAAYIIEWSMKTDVYGFHMPLLYKSDECAEAVESAKAMAEVASCQASAATADLIVKCIKNKSA